MKVAELLVESNAKLLNGVANTIAKQLQIALDEKGKNMCKVTVDRDTINDRPLIKIRMTRITELGKAAAWSVIDNYLRKNFGGDTFNALSVRYSLQQTSERYFSIQLWIAHEGS